MTFAFFVRPLALLVPPKVGNFVPLLFDFAHLNFSILICLIAFPFGYKFVQIIPSELRKYLGSGVVDVDSAWVAHFYLRVEESVARRSNVLFAASFGILAGTTFIVLAQSSSPIAHRWWGHSQFGFAGYYLAIGQAVCCYYAVWGFALLLVLNHHIRQASEHVRAFHPFHPDGYYGFQPLATLVLWEAGVILQGGTALFSTYYIGYFGLEKSLLMLSCMLIFTVGTGAVLAWPLWFLTMRVRVLRASALTRIEPQLQKIVDAFDGDPIRVPNQSATEGLATMMRLHDFLKTSRTVPFGAALLNTVVLGYGLQALILLREFYAKFRMAVP